MSANRDSERILYKHTYNLWRYCNDPIRRRLFWQVLDKYGKRLVADGIFTEAELRQIEMFGEERINAHE